MRAEAMQFAGRQIQRHHAAADAVDHDQVDGEILDKKLGLVLERLLVERMQDGMPGSIGRGAGALRGALAEIGGHAAERPLVDLAFLGARKRHAVVLQFDNRGHRLAAHVLDRVLVAEPVGTLDGVVHMPLPAVRAHVAERSAHAALCRYRVAAGRKHLGNTGGRESGCGHAQGSAQAGAAGADDDDIVSVVDQLVIICHRSGPE